MALALYRKYRPRTFGELIGQEHVTEPLSRALETGRINHAYLFSGPRGCGKTSSARILARSLNCAKGPTPHPCGECDSCMALALDGAGSVDVIEIDAASHGGVDDARDLREKAFFAPVASRYKIYVIDEAHMVTQQGFNALLKLVEEPPEFIVFVFATTEPEKVLGTIRSRTHHYPFRLAPPSVLRPYLEQLCQQEGVAVESAVLPLVVRAGGGSFRDSLSVLDQLIAGAGPEGLTYARAVALLGVTDIALIDEMVDALAAGDGATAFATIDRVADAGHDARRFATDLLERLRDLIVLQQVADAAGSGIIDAPADQLERMTAQASRMGPATLSRLADIIHNGLTEMRGATAPRLLLELITARMLLPGADDSTSGLLHRLERMERRLGAAEPDAASAASEPETAPQAPPAGPATPPASRPAPASAAPARPAPAPTRAPTTPPPAPPPASPPLSAPPLAAPPPAAPLRAQPAPAAAASAGVLDAAAVRRVWDEVLTKVKRKSARLHAFVREGTVSDVQGDEIVLIFRHAVHANSTSTQSAPVLEALHEVLGGSWRLRVEVGEGAASAAPVRTQAPAAPAARPTTAPAADDWPETARLGATASPAPPVPAARPAAPAPAARPAGKAAPARATRPAPARGGRGRDDVPPPPDEPPFDPENDRSYGGFDPGDEPIDDGVPAVRESSEQQAMRAVKEVFAVEQLDGGA